MIKFLENLKGVHEFDEQLNWRILKCKSPEDYHKKYSCATYLKNIKVPSLFYFCEDDPIVNKDCMEIEKTLQNDNILLTSTKYGAHLCSYEHFFKVD